MAGLRIKQDVREHLIRQTKEGQTLEDYIKEVTDFEEDN